jgi:GMP synthase (glutamine-hydrolysing)
MFLIIQNDPHCPPGSCAELLAELGRPFRTVAAFAGEPCPDPAGCDGSIVLGGEMGVHETDRFPYLKGVLDFMGRAVGAGTPLLGICLGGQLLAHLAGGTVASPSQHGEKGVCQVDLNRDGVRDPIFRGVPRNFLTFQLHDDSFTPPPGAVLLGASAACPAQAFRLGRCAYGVQFHPEVDPAIVSCWGALSTPAVDFLPRFHASEPAFRAASRAILENFLSLAAPPRRS